MNFNLIKRVQVTLLSLFLLSFQQGFAADLVVIDAGPTGTYGSIGAAITAATNGDRIIVTNKASLAPWVENLVINKSLTFVSATDNVRFKLQGNITIPAANGREISLIGLESIGGTVDGTSNTTSSRTIVNILGSSFTYNGTAINFNFSGYDLTVANCDLGTTGDIRFKYGKILGNQVGDISKTSVAISTTDKVLISGNKCTFISVSAAGDQLEIRNNLTSEIQTNVLTAGNHAITNNTINMNGRRRGINIGGLAAGSSLIVSNNVITQYVSVSNDNSIALGSNSGSMVTEYNYIRNGAGLLGVIGFNLSTTDVFNSTVGINTVDGRNLAGSPAVNGSNPSIQYYDLDLTTGDAGAYGGSFTLDNYFPLTTGSSRVYHVILDRGVFQGYNLDVKALGFDR
ncbi:MAG: hypothetical protein ACRBFS_00755 [Aureispira sp.]